ncbi:hypothetical protein E3N86_03430 [Cryobacterium sp. Hz7]|uniref:hypothetical protein n=1 Tax=Cryobacterium sp. Hz7 TaxID=1259166 RepID=UPI00106AC1D4|nr:hypothetical protein [Cryobacterium sp. Hz7]TFB64439.1 hypothetical protein E3N86_03430 [Cryobacterium sp. Hz7]
MRRPLALTAIVAAALLTLTACSTDQVDGDVAASSPTPVATATVTPTPEPTPSATPAALPATIIIGAEATDIVTADGTVLASLNYQSDGDAAVAVLRGLLGEPTSESVQESSHYPRAELTEWDCFTIGVNRPDADFNPRPGPYIPAFQVRASGTMATNGVAIEDVNGNQTGQDFESTADGKPADQVHYDETFGIDSVTLDMPSSFSGAIPDYGLPMTYGVIGFTGRDTGIIEKILAPTDSFSLT